MKNVFRIGLLIAMAALGGWLWTLFFPGPEKIVRRQMSHLAKTVTFTAQDSPIARAAKAQKLVGFFSQDAKIFLDWTGYGERTISGREEIREDATVGFASISALAVDFLDVTINVADDKKSAEARCTAKLRIGDNKSYDVQEMRFQFMKIEGAWLITKAETIRTLS